MGDLFERLPPTHHIRVTVHDDLTDGEINRLCQRLTKRLGQVVEYFVEAVHFRKGRRHDHFVVRYAGQHADPEAMLRDLVDAVFVGIDATKEVSVIREEPASVACYLVKDLSDARMVDVELPPDGWRGKLLRTSKGVLKKPTTKRREKPPTHTGVQPPVCWTPVDVGDETGVVAFSFGFDETLASSTSRAPATGGDPLGRALARRVDPTDGLLAEVDVLAVLNSFVRDGGIVGLGQELQCLIERGVLAEAVPGRFALRTA